MVKQTLLPLIFSAALLVMAPPARTQDLVGCSLVEGELSCVPGVSADPQAQIRALRQDIAVDLARQSAIQQGIDGLEALVLAGDARQGALLQAVGAATGLKDLQPQAFHWYRLRPGASHWIWIETAQGPTYQLTPADVGSQIMLVVVATDETGVAGVRRQATAPMGPIAPAMP